MLGMMWRFVEFGPSKDTHRHRALVAMRQEGITKHRLAVGAAEDQLQSSTSSAYRECTPGPSILPGCGELDKAALGAIVALAEIDKQLRRNTKAAQKDDKDSTPGRWPRQGRLNEGAIICLGAKQDAYFFLSEAHTVATGRVEANITQLSRPPKGADQ